MCDAGIPVVQKPITARSIKPVERYYYQGAFADKSTGPKVLEVPPAVHKKIMQGMFPQREPDDCEVLEPTPPPLPKKSKYRSLDDDWSPSKRTRESHEYANPGHEREPDG